MRLRRCDFRMRLRRCRLGMRLRRCSFRMRLRRCRLGMRLRHATHVRRFRRARRLRGSIAPGAISHGSACIVALGCHPDLFVFAGGRRSLRIRIAACCIEYALVFLLQRLLVLRWGGGDTTRCRCGGSVGLWRWGQLGGCSAAEPPPRSGAKRQHDHDQRPQRTAPAPCRRERRAEVRCLTEAAIGLGFLQCFENQRHGCIGGFTAAYSTLRYKCGPDSASADSANRVSGPTMPSGLMP